MRPSNRRIQFNSIRFDSFHFVSFHLLSSRRCLWEESIGMAAILSAVVVVVVVVAQKPKVTSFVPQNIQWIQIGN